MENKDKLLILGSDFSTVHLVQEARKMGVYVIVADLMDHSPTKEIADESWKISTTDIETLIDKIKKESITGVLAGASEFNLENVRKICKTLNLPLYCDSDQAWAVARNKRLFKNLCKKNDVRVAEDYSLTDDLTTDESKQIKFPVVVKPVDKSGNRGMSFCSNIVELKEGIKKAKEISNNEDIIIERQLIGPEYTGYYVIANSEIVLSYYTSMHHQPGYATNLYSLEYITSCHLKQYLKEMNDGIINVLKEAGCTNGIAWVEMMYDKDGHFYALEMGYRFAGPGIYVVHEKLSGFNTYRWMIECALGKVHTSLDLPEPLVGPYYECAGSYDLFTTGDYIIDKIIGLDLIVNLPNVVFDLPKREGDSVKKNTNMGMLKIYGKDCSEMISTIDFINKNFRILNDKGQNIFIIFDNFDAVRKEYIAGLQEFNLHMND